MHKTRWTAQKIAQRIALIEPLVYRRRHPLAPFCYAALPGPLDEPPVGPDVDDSDWPVIKPHTYWGQWRTNFVLRGHFQMPNDWETKKPTALYLPLGEAGDFCHPETLAYIDGVPYATADRHHQEILLPTQWRDGDSHRLALHGWTGMGGWPAAEPGTRLLMHPCAIVQIDQPTRDFIATARVALGVANRLDENEPAKGHLLNGLDEAFKILDTREPYDRHFYDSVAPAHEALRNSIAQAGSPLDVDIAATGHAHIDVAWLWTLGQTRRKAGRTFYNVLRLMEQFPDYHFTQSQPQLYDYVRQDYPELFAAIKQRVAEGRWEPIGGTWVEMDCNVSGPESLARQFLLGRTFFQAHFGPDAESPVLWLPDVFGYAWNLPQLIKQAGLEYFFTIKLGWSQYNRFPYDSFWWQGLDGTRVLTHFSTTPWLDAWFGNRVASTYNATVTPAQVIGTWVNFQQKELEQELLMAFGHGDGGGGPTREMLENIREMAAFPATPRLRQTSVGDFFRTVEAKSGDRLPTWNGELYLELHRGTYTTQGRNKLANRKSEFLLHDAEFLAVLAALLDADFCYPADTLRQAWELVCLNQFHDVIPGSSIGPVYDESLAQYAQVLEIGANVRDTALSVIADRVAGNLLIVNPTGFARHDLAFWRGQPAPGQHLRHADGTPVPTQSAADGVWIAPGELTPFSLTPLTVAEGKAPIPDTGLAVTPTLLENNHLRVELSDAGDIIRIYDKTTRREVLPTGALANQFQAFEDRPLEWDAWDIDVFFDDKMWTSDPAASVRVVETGPLRATLEIRRRILHSEYTQRISLAYNSPRLDFETVIDWRERHTLLKVAFPVEVLSPVATYEIQWGNVQRPTHRNTSWDWARFETCAQKWVDLSEGGYGVSLLNDCKYGHDIQGNIIRLSLLRSPTMPDPEADQGEHRFVYSLLPHAGKWNEVTIANAYALNDPLLVTEKQGGRGAGGGGAEGGGTEGGGTEGRYKTCPYSLFSIDCPNVVIETIKQAEDGNGIIVRFYESQRRRGEVTLMAGFALDGVWRTDLLEEDQVALTPDGNQVSLAVKPYEIVTLRLVPA
ncbi:MAG: alpha-mannosidase [Chloroflexota bacterium]|nr:alpha-mannosidase [Chloroflexota bacterium]